MQFVLIEIVKIVDSFVRVKIHIEAVIWRVESLAGPMEWLTQSRQVTEPLSFDRMDEADETHLELPLRARHYEDPEIHPYETRRAANRDSTLLGYAEHHNGAKRQLSAAARQAGGDLDRI